MLHSKVTSKGQTTIPGKIHHATIRVHPGTRSVKGVLANKKGKGMSFAQIRKAVRVANA